MSDSLKREHVHPLALNAAHTIALSKLQGSFEIGKSASIELALNQGLYDLGVLSEDDYKHFDARYKRPLKEIIAENQIKRENSHIPKLELERKKRQAIFCPQKRTPEEIINSTLKGMCEQWEDHKDLAWRFRTLAFAKKYPDNEFAKLIIAKECDNISPKSEESAI